jgi:carboxyl-terminal processing protease
MKRQAIVALAVLLAGSLGVGDFASARISASTLESQELTLSYSLMTSEFYKKSDPQTLLDGARNELVLFLKKNGVDKPNVPAVRASDDVDRNARELDRELESVVGEYGARFGSRQLTYAAISGLVASVKDRYTTFLTPKEFADLNEGLDGGNFGGVGIAIRVDEQLKTLLVVDVIPGTPAERAGIKQNDAILTIDGKPTLGLKSEEDSKLLRGKEGTVVRVTVERDGKPLPDPISITRAVIHQPSVYSRMLDGGIGYARLTVFGANTASELSNALDKLDSQGAKGYVLDLRDNGGGYLNAAIDVSSKFIATAPIVSVESRGGNNTEYVGENIAMPPKPLAVLVNHYTASASEITSGAIQDNGVGQLIGERTFGKGVVQTIHPLPDGSAVKITSARYLTPHGRDINTVGIQPDITAQTQKGDKLGDPTSDSQLKAALGYLRGKIASTTGS